MNQLEKIKHPQEYEDAGISILDDLNEKVRIDTRKQHVFKWSRNKNKSDFVISHDYFECPRTSNWANAKLYHTVKPSNLRYVQNLYQSKASMDMTLNEFK